MGLGLELRLGLELGLELGSGLELELGLGLGPELGGERERLRVGDGLGVEGVGGDALGHVLGLRGVEDDLVEDRLQLLVGVVDQQLRRDAERAHGRVRAERSDCTAQMGVCVCACVSQQTGPSVGGRGRG